LSLGQAQDGQTRDDAYVRGPFNNTKLTEIRGFTHSTDLKKSDRLVERDMLSLLRNM